MNAIKYKHKSNKWEQFVNQVQFILPLQTAGKKKVSKNNRSGIRTSNVCKCLYSMRKYDQATIISSYT